MKLTELFEAEKKFILQQRDGKEWKKLADELYTHDEAQEFLNASKNDDPRVKERAVSVDGKTTLHPHLKNPKTKDVLARHASKEVHKRNADFFDKYL